MGFANMEDIYVKAEKQEARIKELEAKCLDIANSKEEYVDKYLYKEGLVIELEKKLAEAVTERDWNKNELERVADFALRVNSALKYCKTSFTALQSYVYKPEIDQIISEALLKIKAVKEV